MSGPRPHGAAVIDRDMRRASRALSLLAFALMLLGLTLSLAGHLRTATPLDPTLLDLRSRPSRLMLWGILLLCLLPGVRVLIALSHYTAARRVGLVVVALLVLLELIASAVTGG